MTKTVLSESTVPGLYPLFYLSVGTAVAAGVFCLVFVGMLVANYYSPLRPQDIPPLSASETTVTATTSTQPSVVSVTLAPFLRLPTEYHRFVELKSQLQNDPKNPTLIDEVRNLDMVLRLDYFRRRENLRHSAPALWFAAAVFITATCICRVLYRKLPVPDTAAPTSSAKDDGAAATWGVHTVVIVGTLLIGVAIGLITTSPSRYESFLLARNPVKASDSSGENGPPLGGTTNGGNVTDTNTAIVAAAPVLEMTPQQREAFWLEMEQNWPMFRGPDGSGISRFQNMPVKWDVDSGENIRWKTEIPLPGANSPVVWNDRVFLAGATDTQRQIYCFDANTGKILWTLDVAAAVLANGGKRQTVPEVDQDTGFAAPTLATDGNRVYGIFPNGDLLAVSWEGRCLWAMSLGTPENHYGYSSSLALYFDRVIVQFDQGEAKDAKSKIMAVRGADGKILWEVARNVHESWPSPVVRKIGDRWQILTIADPFVISYDPETGQELWRYKGINGDTGPSPTAFGNLVFAAATSPGMIVLDGNSNGEISRDGALWIGEQDRPDTCSPLAMEGFVFTLESAGYMGCYDVATGTLHWELEVGDGASFYSSPSLVGEYLYLFSKDDDEAAGFVIDPSKAELEKPGRLKKGIEPQMTVATNPMGEAILSSPAFTDGRMYIRGAKHLFCIEENGH